MSLPLVTRFGADPLLDLEIANKRYVDNSSGGGGTWSVLDTTYEASIAESTHTFTFAAIDFDDDSMLVLVVDGIATLTTMELAIQIGGDTTANYYSDGFQIESGTETIIDINAQTSARILPATLVRADRVFAGVMNFYLEKGATGNNEPQTTGMMTGIGGMYNVKSQLIADVSSIASVTILAPVSSWKIGTRFTLYKVSRS